MTIDLVPAQALIVSAAVAPADTDKDHVSSPVVFDIEQSAHCRHFGDMPLDTPMHPSASAGLDVEPMSRVSRNDPPLLDSPSQTCPRASRRSWGLNRTSRQVVKYSEQRMAYKIR